MALPITIPNTFAGATTSIPLSQLDNNFTTVVNGVNGIGNGTNSLANVSITGGAISNVSLSSSNVTITGGTINAASITNSTASLSSPLGVASGGTNAATLTANNVILGNGTNTVQVVAPGASGNVLTSNGTTWASSVATGGTGLALMATLSPTNGTTSIAATGLSAYSSIKIVISGIGSAASSALVFQVSSNNGGVYSSSSQNLTSNSLTPTGFAEIFRTNVSSSNKPYYCVNGSSAGTAADAISTVTGVINAVKIVNVSSSFNGTGSIYLYGVP
jgi:hypothetical protein